MSKWTDTTSYRRGERGDAEPRCWSIDVGPVHISVLKGHLYHPGKWVMHCDVFRIDAKVIGDDSKITAEEAQTAAIEIVRSRADELAAAFAKYGV